MKFALFLLLSFVIVVSAWPESWRPLRRAPVNEEIEFTLALQQRNLEEFNRIFESITNPTSPNYGNYLTIEQVNDIIAPSKEDQQLVLDYLTANSCTGTSYGDFIIARGPTQAVEKLFKVDMFVFHNEIHKVELRRSINSPTIPRELANIVEFVTGIATFPATRGVKDRKVQTIEEAARAGDTWIVPQTLKSIYGIPANTVGTNPQNSMAVAEFGTIAGISQNDLNSFNQLVDGPHTQLNYTVGPFGFTPINPIDGESTLDVQYIMAVAEGIPCSFWTINGWVYDFTVLVQQRQSSNQPVPLVFSLSYAWSEDLQCEVTGNGASCAQVGGSDQTYAETTSTNFQKLGATGITLLSASGDAGAASKSNIDCSNTTYPIQAEFPASSPFMTSVGGTMLQNGGTALTGDLPPFCQKAGVTCAGGGTEIVCSVPTALITTGGGFSSFLPAQSFQASAVQSWLNSNALQPPSRYFNASGRGSPDVAALAHHYMIVENGNTLGVDGTSASTPVTAGIIALINDARLNAGKSPVGFINPAIYAMSSSNFNDVTSGDNTGTEMHGLTGTKYCSTYGYGATTGWDPTTGRGTPRYSSWASYFLSLN